MYHLRITIFITCYYQFYKKLWHAYTVYPLIRAGPQISAGPLGICIEISATPLISVASLNAAVIGIVTIFY